VKRWVDRHSNRAVGFSLSQGNMAALEGSCPNFIGYCVCVTAMNDITLASYEIAFECEVISFPAY
jgi:hypothetical protein